MKKTIIKNTLLLIMLLPVTILATANSDGLNDKDKSKPAQKDMPLKTVEIFNASPLPSYPVVSSRATVSSYTNDVQLPAPRPAGAGSPVLGAIGLRLDSLIAKSKTQTVTTTQYTKAKKKRNRRAIKVTKTVERRYTLGLYVYDITADSVVYAYNENQMLTPASTQKLFVASTFLSTRGSDFTFDTSMTTNGRIEKDSIGHPYFKGDIYLHGSFDPTLTMEDVRAMTNAIRSLNVDSIDGRIIVDDHIKESIMQSKGWQWGNIPLSEEFTFTPVTFNEGRASNGGRTRHPELYFASTICKQLIADYVTFSTEEPWDISFVPVRGKKELIRLTTPCQEVLSRMLKRSNNTFAESVLLNVCKDDDKWSYERCRDLVRNTVRSSIRYANKHRQDGKPKRNEENLSDYYTIIDGSGLSHSNKTTAESQVNLLRYIASDRALFSEMYTHLPIAGIDGTISKRMTADVTRNNVRAKTGTVNAVSTLSGYVTAPSGNLLSFSILVNNTYDKAFAHTLQDQICRELAQ